MEFLKVQRAQLSKLKADNDADFVVAVKILLRTGEPQRVIASKIGVNPATVSRWAHGEKLPSRPLLRDAYLREMQRAMAELIS